MVLGICLGSCLLSIDVARHRKRQVVGVDGVGCWVYTVFMAFTVLGALTDLGDVAVSPC